MPYPQSAGQNKGLPKHPINYDECDSSESTDIELEGVPARVERVHVEGLARTKDDIVQDAVRDLFCATDFQAIYFLLINKFAESYRLMLKKMLSCNS